MKRGWLLAKRFWEGSAAVGAAVEEEEDEGMEAERDRREESRCGGLACLRRLAGREERREGAAGIAGAGTEVRREQIGVGMASEAASSSRRHCE